MRRGGLCGILLAGLLWLIVSDALPQDSKWLTYRGGVVRHPVSAGLSAEALPAQLQQRDRIR